MEVGQVPNMNLQTIKTNPQFCGKSNNESRVKIKEHPDYFEKTVEVEASTGKKWLVGLASLAFPGLGSIINGEIGKGLLFGGIGLSTLVGGGILSLKKRSKKIAFAALPILLVNKIVATISAVKNAKSKITTVEYKDQQTENKPTEKKEPAETAE